jgi:TrmH family RNA methyltransferase
LIGEIPDRKLDTLPLERASRLLVLDGIQDPGNVGTLLRTAAAFGVDATLAMPGTVDLWNSKVVRSAMGALFHRPALSCTWDALDEFLRARSLPLWGADAGGAPVDGLRAPAAPGLALAVGNEGAGLSAETRSRAARLVSIPIAPDVESLNVAVAAGILLHHFRT